MTALRGGHTHDPHHREHSATLIDQPVTTGQQITVRGIRGRCRFCALVTNGQGQQWIDCIDRRGNLRAFDLERVVRVHRG